MRLIRKGVEPLSLTEHRSSSNSVFTANFGNLSTEAKDELRAALVKEQGGLCCYCMSRIKNDGGRTKIEHWTAQSKDHRQDLDYRNLLAACLGGGEGGTADSQHCDTRKGSNPITLDPRTPSRHPDQLQYSSDGKMYHSDPTLQADIEVRLNLNLPKLARNRRAALEGWQDAIKKRYGVRGQWSLAALARERERLEGRQGDNAVAYLGILLHWLRKKGVK